MQHFVRDQIPHIERGPNGPGSVTIWPTPVTTKAPNTAVDRTLVNVGKKLVS